LSDSALATCTTISTTRLKSGLTVVCGLAVEHAVAVDESRHRTRADYEQVVTVERPVHEANLAWELAHTAKPYLNAVERNDIFVAFGAGETFAAIRELVKCVAIRRIPVGPDLVQRSVSWLDVYAGHEDERYLRRLIEDFVFPIAIRTSATLRVDRLSTSPQQPSQPAALTRGLRHPELPKYSER
jgi:hypothetical protein